MKLLERIRHSVREALAVYAMTEQCSRQSQVRLLQYDRTSLPGATPTSRLGRQKFRHKARRRDLSHQARPSCCPATLVCAAQKGSRSAEDLDSGRINVVHASKTLAMLANAAAGPPPSPSRHQI
eukprot:6172862-Pleurochrysis_carterae.AAC.1